MVAQAMPRAWSGSLGTHTGPGLFPWLPLQTQQAADVGPKGEGLGLTDTLVGWGGVGRGGREALNFFRTGMSPKVTVSEANVCKIM